MTTPAPIRFADVQTDDFKELTGKIAVFVTPDGGLDASARRVNGLTRKSVARLIESEAWQALGEGKLMRLAYPAGLAAQEILVVKLARNPSQAAARAAGSALAQAQDGSALTVCAGAQKRAADVALALALRGYAFDTYLSAAKTPEGGEITLRVSKPEDLAREARDMAAVAEGVFFTRDLVNEPANILTTDDFAARLAAMQELGLDVEILEEDALEELGMRLLLSVGQGSAAPSKVVVMRWNGGGDEAPLALVGKGVVFDTGGISLKPPAGMEQMTGDMGGAGTVAGVMRTLALRKAKANVVGLVGLVENMPSGTATRPGDVVRSMKGDTVEIINTDAEGRLVLADVLWYAQERFKPSGVIDLATLTGAMLVALGHEHAGVFSNDDTLAGAVLKAAQAEGEGAWRMPIDEAYGDSLKSRIADVKNSGTRQAGASVAARFLARFIQDDMPWVHLDIAGASSRDTATVLGPKGATGWGVMTLNRMIRDLQG